MYTKFTMYTKFIHVKSTTKWTAMTNVGGVAQRDCVSKYAFWTA